MEALVKNIRAYDRIVSGCQRHGADVMLSFRRTDEKRVVHDLFISNEQAEALIKELQEAVAENQQ